MKASPRCRHVPVIMMTAIYRGWRFAQDARETYGAEDYIEKPFRLDDVLRRIDAVLEATASRSRGDSAAAAAELARGKELLLADRLPEAAGGLRGGHRRRSLLGRGPRASWRGRCGPAARPSAP